MDAGIDNKNRHLVTVSKDTLRARATKFIHEWEGQHRERAECQIFWHEFFAMFDVRSVDIGMYEEAAKRASTGGDGRIDYLIPWELAVEHKTTGEDLDKAMGQLIDYLPSLKQKQPPKLLVTCDFANFEWHNLETGESGKFPLEELIPNLDLFWWLAGHQARGAESFEDEEEANLKATDLMAKLYDAVVATGYDEHALREWLTRILFCLFADDTDVWPRNAFVNFIHFRTQSDGSDFGPQIRMLFELLNMDPKDRPPTLDTDLADFTYINGDLFSNELPMVWANEDVRTYLLQACHFDWSRISPAIFGSMFQNVMTPAERRHLGAHYTTLENILNTIRPLFLDDLEEELAKATTVPALERFHNKLASLKFMDPACGCGNFLVVTYGELRRLERECLEKIRDKQGRGDWQTLGVHLLFKVNVSQFYGIEIEEFPARIARTALYLMDHSWNREVSKVFGQYFIRFPIPASPHIVIANALRMDWGDALPASDASFVMGNPPFVGALMLSADQTTDRKSVFAGLPEAKGLQTGRLDYVMCWYAKFFEYAANADASAAFVSTNSICQGEQARSLGPLLERCGFEISFAYRTFPWTNEARGKAVVHCIIVGLRRSGTTKGKLIFEIVREGDPVQGVRATNVNAWLIDAPNVILEKRRTPMVDGLPVFTVGSQPTDAGGLVFGEETRDLALKDPIASKYLRPLLGAEEMLHGKSRWCLWMVDARPEDLARSTFIKERLAIVKALRDASPTASFRETPPYLFTHRKQPTTSYLAVPRHSSELRRVVPISVVDSNVIAHDSLMIVKEDCRWLLGIMQSAMYTAWIRTVCGRIKSDIRVSGDLAYNAFPFPTLTDTERLKLTVAANAILDARAAHPGATLSDLYDPLAMPMNLARAHDALDKVVDALFAPRKRFKSDADRLAVLFERHEALSSTAKIIKA